MKWEYKVDAVPLGDAYDGTKALNYLGADEWELVQVIPVDGKDATVILKKPKK